MVRFHIVVINFDRICLFLNNFERIKNFDPNRDQIYIFDCSNNPQIEQSKVMEFFEKKGWIFNAQFHFIRRKNWGVDQGARIDYFTFLNQLPSPPKYIWQFQEHYLDLTSPASRFPAEMPRIGGEIKPDIAPDELIIDLDECEHIYEEYPSVSLLYAARLKMILFAHLDGREWFYANGGNSSIRTSYALKVYNQNLLDSYKMIYDGTTDCALFMEMDLGRKLTKPGVKWYDLISRYSFDLPESLRKLETKNNICLQQPQERNHEDYYSPIYSKYEQRSIKALATPSALRKVLIEIAFALYDIKLILRKLKRRILPQPASKPLIVLQDGELKKY